jgi:hypothetical protein
MTPHRLSRQEAHETARAFLAQNQIFQLLIPEDVIDTCIKTGCWQITDDQTKTRPSGVQA